MEFIDDLVHIILAMWIVLVSDSALEVVSITFWIPHPENLGCIAWSQCLRSISRVPEDGKHHPGVWGGRIVDESRVNSSLLKERRL